VSWRAKNWLAHDEADARDMIVDACRRGDEAMQEVLDWLSNDWNRSLLPVPTFKFIARRITGAQTDLRRAKEHAEGKDSEQLGRRRRHEAHSEVRWH
jgi:hypothetical protein